MASMSKLQWAKVLESARRAGAFSTMEPRALLSYLREGGLSRDEEELIRDKATTDMRMAELERWLRLRPHLLDSLRLALTDLNCPDILQALDGTLASTRESDEFEDEDRFRHALRCHQEELTEVGEWLVPHLWQYECLTDGEKNQLAKDPAPLVDVLMSKSAHEWRRLMACLREKHKDLFLWISRLLDPAAAPRAPDPPVEKTMKVWNSVQAGWSRSYGDGGKTEKAEASVGTDPWLEELPAVRVQVTGAGSFLLALRPSDAVGRAVALLRRRGVLMGVRAARAAGGEALSDVPGWRQRSLADSGVGAGSALVVDPFVPAAVHVEARAPTRKEGEALAVPTRGRAVSWADLRPEFESRRGEKVSAALLVREGTLARRHGVWRRSLRSADPETGAVRFVDEDDGADADVRAHLAWDLVRASDVLAAAPALLPVLFLHAPAELAVVGLGRDLLPAPPGAAFDPRAALLLHGLVLRQDGDVRATRLWLEGGGLADVDTGAVFESEEDATAEPRPDGAEWRFLFVALRAGDPVPRCRLPRDRALLALTRRGVAVSVTGGRVAAEGDPEEPDDSRWEVRARRDRLREDLSAAVRA